MPTTTTTTSPDSTTASSPEKDPLHLIDVDHVRFCVGNAKQAAVFYASTFGFRITQLHDLTCGARSMARYMLEQGYLLPTVYQHTINVFGADVVDAEAFPVYGEAPYFYDTYKR